MLKIAIIGTGTMGKEHAAAWANIPEATVTAVYGRNHDRAQALAASCGAVAYTSFEEMVAEADFDIVDICLPTDLHYSFIESAAAAGKHVICEKPLALTSEEARRIIALCENRGVRLFVCHNLRFCPEYEQARRLVDEGELGTVSVVRMFRRSHFPRGAGDWYADPLRSGGVMFDLIIHDLDWLRWTFGEAERVTALHFKRSEGAEPLEYALVTIRMSSGVLVHIEGSWAHTDFESGFEISGSKGMLVEKMADSMPLALGLRAEPGMAAPVAVPELTLNQNSYELQMAHIVDCMLRDTKPLLNPFDAMKAVELSEAATISARTGQPFLLSGKGEK